MTGLRELLEQATPGPWEFVASEMTIRGGAFRSPIAVGSRITSIARADASLIALAPELARLVLDMGEELAAWYAIDGHRSDTTAALLARLDRIGKEEE